MLDVVMTLLPLGCEGNRVVNWEGVLRERVREFSPEDGPAAREVRSRRDPRRPHAVRRRGRTRRKPLRLLA